MAIWRTHVGTMEDTSWVHVGNMVGHMLGTFWEHVGNMMATWWTPDGSHLMHMYAVHPNRHISQTCLLGSVYCMYYANYM